MGAKRPTVRELEERLAQTEERLGEAFASLMRSVQELGAAVNRLASRLDLLEKATATPPGLHGFREATNEVLVGGVPVRVKALPPAEWVRSTGELPAFVFMLLKAEKTEDPKVSEELASKAVEIAKRWIAASAVEGAEYDLDLLTVPEAIHAVGVIARLNGIDEAVAEFFRSRLGVTRTAPRPGGEAVRDQAERAPRASTSA